MPEVPKQKSKVGPWVALIHHPAKRQAPLEIWDAEPVNEIWFNRTIALKQISIVLRGSMPVLLPARVALPSGPLNRSPSELLAAFQAGQRSEDEMWMVVFGVLLLLVLGTGVLALWWKPQAQQVPPQPFIDIEAQVARCAAEREEVYTSLHAVQRRLDFEVTQRNELAKFVDSAAEQVAPEIARMRADIDMLVMAFAPPVPPPPADFRRPPGL